MDKKDIWKTNKFAIQWKNKLANKEDRSVRVDRFWGNVIMCCYILLVVGWFIWLYNI